MSLHMSAPVIVASGWVIYPGRIKFPSNSFSKLISSMFGASTSCDLSHSLGALLNRFSHRRASKGRKICRPQGVGFLIWRFGLSGSS